MPVSVSTSIDFMQKKDTYRTDTQKSIISYRIQSLVTVGHPSFQVHAS
jgi:hypothetical protein